MKHLFGLTLLVASSLAHAGGPIAPDGWDGSHDAALPSGQPCCIPADLSGTGLVGGAFTLISSTQEEFALFALTYTPPVESHWQLLERHPISLLPDYRVSVVPSGGTPSIKACTAVTECTHYALASATGHFKAVGYADDR